MVRPKNIYIYIHNDFKVEKRSLCIIMKSSSCSLQLEKAGAQQRRPSAAKKKKKKKKPKRCPEEKKLKDIYTQEEGDWRINNRFKELRPSNCRTPQLGLTTHLLERCPGGQPGHLWPPCSQTLNPPVFLMPDWATIPGVPWGLAMGLMVQSTYAPKVPSQ